MVTQDLLNKLSTIEESARVNRFAVASIINDVDLTDEVKKELIVGITIPLTLSTKKLLKEIGELYKK